MSGMLLLALSLIVVLPPVVINLLMGGKVLKMIGSLLTGRGPNVVIDVLGPMLVTFLLPAIVVAIVGVVLLLGKHDRRRCCKALFWCVGFSILMLAWPLLPIPWNAMGVPNAYASRLSSFSWSALHGLFLMEGWAVAPHVLVIVLLWCLALYFGGITIAQLKKEGLGATVGSGE